MEKVVEIKMTIKLDTWIKKQQKIGLLEMLKLYDVIKLEVEEKDE